MEKEKTRSRKKAGSGAARKDQEDKEEGAMTVIKRGGKWWFEFQFMGQRIRESSHSKSKVIAERAERNRRTELELGANRLEKVAKPKLFSVAAAAYLLEREPHWSKKTGEMHANSLKHLEPHFGKMLLNQISAEEISRYQRLRLGQKTSGRTVSNRTINIEVGLVRLVLGKAKLWNAIADDVTMLKEREDVGRELSDDEVRRLLMACANSVSRGLYTAVLTSIHTGLRAHELCRLRWFQINLLEGIITVGKSKTQGGEGRVVYLSTTALQTLQKWLAQFPDSQPSHAVFPREAYGLKGKKGVFGGKVVPYKTFPDKPVGSFATAWRAAKKAAGIECRWHDLRHSAASRIAAGGATDQTLQALLGWMSPKMIEKYSHVRAAAKRKAVSVFDEVAAEGGSPQNPPRDNERGEPIVH